MSILRAGGGNSPVLHGCVIQHSDRLALAGSTQETVPAPEALLGAARLLFHSPLTVGMGALGGHSRLCLCFSLCLCFCFCLCLCLSICLRLIGFRVLAGLRPGFNNSLLIRFGALRRELRCLRLRVRIGLALRYCRTRPFNRICAGTGYAAGADCQHDGDDGRQQDKGAYAQCRGDRQDRPESPCHGSSCSAFIYV